MNFIDYKNRLVKLCKEYFKPSISIFFPSYFIFIYFVQLVRL